VPTDTDLPLRVQKEHYPPIDTLVFPPRTS